MSQNKICIIDTEPLILYILWKININLVWNFQRIKWYTKNNFFELNNFISKYKDIYVTSHVRNEFSHHTLEWKEIFRLQDTDKKELISFLTTCEIWDCHIKVNEVILDNWVYRFWFADISCLKLSQETNAPIITSDWEFADYLIGCWIKAHKFRPIVWFENPNIY